MAPVVEATTNGRESTTRSDKKENEMLEGLFQPMHLMAIAAIALLIFGPKKLPELGKGLGESIRGFKAAMAGKDGEDKSRSNDQA